MTEALRGQGRPPLLPECPSRPEPGVATKLPENYPPLAIVVPLRGKRSEESEAANPRFLTTHFAISVIENVLMASGDRVPVLLLPGRKAIFDTVLRELPAIARNLGGTKDEQRDRLARWRRALVHVPTAEGWIWQQDYFETTHDPRTGAPVLREIEGYSSRSDMKASAGSYDALAKALGAACPAARRGSALPARTVLSRRGDDDPGAYSGGNIEALPGGLCLHGDNQPWEYARHYCGSKDNEVVVPTSWLRVGHVDEIVGVVRDSRPAPPCDFAVTVASPRKALELLENDRDELFIDLTDGAGIYRHPQLTRLCRMIRSGGDYVPPEIKPDEEPEPGRSVTRARWPRLLPAAWAEDALDGGVSPDIPQPELDECFEAGKVRLKNGEVADFLRKRGTFGDYNRLVQQLMDKAKATITSKLKSRLPQCQIKIIDVPALYEGGKPVTRMFGPDELPKELGAAIHPAPANALSMGDIVLSPDPRNKAFSEYLRHQYAALGMKTALIDTYDVAHTSLGNLHCTTHAIPICRPHVKGR